MEPHAGLAPEIVVAEFEELPSPEELLESGQLAEVIPLLERQRSGRPKLPGERSIHDFEEGDYVLTMLIVDANGTRQLVPGQVDSVTEWGNRVNPDLVTCDGFINLKLFQAPGRMVGINADFGSLIPIEAFDEFKRDPDYLVAWLRSGAIDTRERADIILAELQDRYAVGLDVDARWQGPLQPCLVQRRGELMQKGKVYELAAS